MILQSNLTLAALLLAATLAPALAAPATPDYLPPPGYYRVDMDASQPSINHGKVAYTTRTQVDGATSDMKVTTVKPDRTSSQTYAAGKPHTVCFKPGQSQVPAIPAGACVGGKPEVRGGVATFRARCAGMDAIATMRKINASTWEMVNRIDNHGSGDEGGGVEEGIAELRKAFEEQARSKDPDERANAKKELANFKATADEMRAEERAERGTGGAAGPHADVFTQRFTRLADRCPAGK